VSSMRGSITTALPVAALSLALLGACGSASPRSAADPTPPPSSAGDVSATTPNTDPPTIARVPNELRPGPGVSPAELRRASRLLTETIAALPRWHTPAEAYAAGYRSIGDTKSVVEHYVNWSYVNDGHILDPARPESIVFQRRNGAQVAVAAMYSLPLGSTFADVPDVGGALTQWHVHRNLCLTDDPHQKIILRFTAADGSCPAGTAKASNTPMLHVWTVPNPCGPFASLELGGQFPDGETRNCDTRNASVP
jgi:hypothetical protein